MFECVVLVNLLNSLLIIRLGSLSSPTNKSLLSCHASLFQQTIVISSFGFYRLIVGLFVGYYFLSKCTVTFPADYKALPLDSLLTTDRLFFRCSSFLFTSRGLLFPILSGRSYLYKCIIPSSSVQSLLPFSSNHGSFFPHLSGGSFLFRGSVPSFLVRFWAVPSSLVDIDTSCVVPHAKYGRDDLSKKVRLTYEHMVL
jgi:hypothetical protein